MTNKKVFIPTKSPFAGKVAAKQTTPFLGNGLSRTAMLFRIATMAGHRLTVPELNRIRDINPRQLERTYEAVVGGVGMTKGDALFALRLILK